MNDGLTEKQAKAFWRAFAQACSELRLSGKAETEPYRKRVLMEECGVGHMADVSRTTGFEKLMMRWATLRGRCRPWGTRLGCIWTPVG